MVWFWSIICQGLVGAYGQLVVKLRSYTHLLDYTWVPWSLKAIMCQPEFSEHVYRHMKPIPFNIKSSPVDAMDLCHCSVGSTSEFPIVATWQTMLLFFWIARSRSKSLWIYYWPWKRMRRAKGMYSWAQDKLNIRLEVPFPLKHGGVEYTTVVVTHTFRVGRASFFRTVP